MSDFPEPLCRYGWYHCLDENEVDPTVLSVANNVLNFVAADLGFESPIRIVWFAIDSEKRVDAEPTFQDEHEVISTFPERLLREGAALGIDRIGGFTPEASTTLMMIRADVFNPDDSSRDLLRVTIAHEMRHIWQNLNWASDDRADGNRCEDDALAYQVNSINRYIAKHSVPD
jgi:hypothetical protein